MRVRALRSFSGAVCMGRGQEADISDEYILKDLLRAGYIAVANPQTDAQTQAELAAMHYNDLKKLAKEKGLDSSGTKEELLARISEAGEAE